jgi:hypothetical protein
MTKRNLSLVVGRGMAAIVYAVPDKDRDMLEEDCLDG